MDAKVMEIDKLSDDTFEQHNYIAGTWKKDLRHDYEIKQDTCSKCGLERHMLRSELTDWEGVVTTYWRAKTMASPGHEPLCWGALNP